MPRAIVFVPVADALAALRARHAREESALLLSALRRAMWSLSGAARLLGVRVSTLQRALARHPSIEAERVRRRADAASRAA